MDWLGLDDLEWIEARREFLMAWSYTRQNMC